MKRKISNVVCLLAAFLVAGCAKEGFPSGGPKDTEPPKVLGANPPSGTTRWDVGEFAIFFDEYVTVKEADKNILVSPPMDPKPEYGTKGRGLVVKIKDTLWENTTYLFQFKNGVADFNEGNVLESYEYVFSTGSSIDSMAICGQVVDALTLAPRDGEIAVTVVAYGEEQLGRFAQSRTTPQDSLSGTCADSIVVKEKPMYMTRCDKAGRFAMNHMRAGRYKVLAFEDGDNNLLLGSGDAVAFSDTLVRAVRMPLPVDTARRDTTAAVDSSSAGLNMADQIQPTPVVLSISQRNEQPQRLTKAEFTGKGQIVLTAARSLTARYVLRPLDSLAKGPLYVRSSTNRDTLWAWTHDRSCDSIALFFTDEGISDTLRLVYRSSKVGTAQGGKFIAKTPAKGLLKSSVTGKHPYYDTLWIDFERPVRGVVPVSSDSLVSVTDLSDSTTRTCGVRWVDSCTPNGYYRAMVDFEGKPGGRYRFRVPAQSFRDVYGATHHDSLIFNMEYTKVEDYGNIYVKAVGVHASTLLQLLNEKGEVLRQHAVDEDGRVGFLHLKGGKYRLRAVTDSDGSGDWTAGDYWKQRQPEAVVYFGKELDLRENWDMEEVWTLDSGGGVVNKASEELPENTETDNGLEGSTK